MLGCIRGRAKVEKEKGRRKKKPRVKATHLCISRIGVENITEKLARYGHTSYHEAVYVVRVDDKRLTGQLAHPVKVDEERKEDFVGSGTIFQNAKQIRFEGDGGNITGVKCEGARRVGECLLRGIELVASRGALES